MLFHELEVVTRCVLVRWIVFPNFNYPSLAPITSLPDLQHSPSLSHLSVYIIANCNTISKLKTDTHTIKIASLHQAKLSMASMQPLATCGATWQTNISLSLLSSSWTTSRTAVQCLQDIGQGLHPFSDFQDFCSLASTSSYQWRICTRTVLEMSATHVTTSVLDWHPVVCKHC